MQSIRVVFLGSPDFAVPSLQALVQHPSIDVTLVVTQPDRRAGRGRKLRSPAAKAAAEDAGIPVIQPETLRDADAVATIHSQRPDVLLVVSYGELLRRNVLELAPLGCLNVHPSLLPRYRGATPIPAAILNGDPETGITVMRLVRKLDAGPILFQHPVVLSGSETTGELTERLAEEAARILPDIVTGWAAGGIAEVTQDESLATYTRELRKSDAQIDWAQPAIYIERFVRAMDPWPGAWTLLGEQRIAVSRVSIEANSYPELIPGMILASGGRVLVGTGDGVIELIAVQPAGRQIMPATDWHRGLRHTDSLAFDPPTEPRPPFIETM